MGSLAIAEQDLPKVQLPHVETGGPLFQQIMRLMPFRSRILNRAAGAGLLPARVKARIFGVPTMLDLREGIQRTMFVGDYEPVQTRWFRECLGLGDTVVDAGASFGHYTALSAALVGREGRVFAFEPSPLAAEGIEHMIAGSPGIGNIVLTKSALGRSNGTVEIFLPDEAAWLYTPSILPSDPAFKPLTVALISLDDFAEDHGIDFIKLIKIDVEGFEPDVIAGMERLIGERRVENVICELNSGWLERNGTTPDGLRRQILELGFRVKAETATQQGRYGEMEFTLQDVWFEALPN